MTRYKVVYINHDLSEVLIGFFSAMTADEARAMAADMEGGENEPVTRYAIR